MIRVVRVRDLAPPDSGARYLVDRLWPRGVRKRDLDLAGWAREVAPSHELRRWFGHDPSRWDEFRCRYTAQLDADPTSWGPLLDAAATADLLLLYDASDPTHNNAVVLRDYLYEQLEERSATTHDDSGDPACWLACTCSNCGSVRGAQDARACSRCGAVLPAPPGHVHLRDGRTRGLGLPANGRPLPSVP